MSDSSVFSCFLCFLIEIYTSQDKFVGEVFTTSGYSQNILGAQPVLCSGRVAMEFLTTALGDSFIDKLCAPMSKAPNLLFSTTQIKEK
jgi:hypothetical protein